MNILAVDTSGSFCSVALSVAGQVFSLSSAGTGDHFEQLPRMVQELCESSGVQPGSIQEVRIGLGPGSFTGLRIGMSFVKGLSWSLRMPLTGYSSFAAVAAAAFVREETPERVVVVADARRDEGFVAQFSRGSGVDVAPCIIPIAELHMAPWSIAEDGVAVVSPQRDFSIEGVSIRSEGEAARGILLLPVGAQLSFNIQEIAIMEPTYLRAVAAKTIEERKIGA